MEYRVISADDHVDLRWMPADLWMQRLPHALRDRGPRVQELEKGPYWVCDGRTWGPWGAYTAAQGSGARWALEAAGAMREGELRPTTPDLRLADMDRDGVDATVMYGPTDPFTVQDLALRREVYKAYNDWLTEFQAAKPERLIGAAQLPLDDPEGARDELQRLSARGFKHYNLMAARAEPPVYDDAWEPFWSLAEEVDIPIGFHLVVEVRRDRPQNAAVEQAQNPLVAGALRTTLNMQGFQLMDPIAGLILNGVLDRHPGLRLVMAEAGLAWVPHFIQSLDFYVNRIKSGRAIGGVSGEQKLPELMPSEYFERQIWVTFQDDRAGMNMLGYLDEDRVMWASDYPHPASTWPNSQAVIEAQMKHLSPATKQKVLSGNARKLYAL
jgi:predicted TIM-barrel fold metal-dependent hydrolase